MSAHSFILDGVRYFLASADEAIELQDVHDRVAAIDAGHVVRGWLRADDERARVRLAQLLEEVRGPGSATRLTEAVDDLADDLLTSLVLLRERVFRPAISLGEVADPVPLHELTDEPIEEDEWHWVEIELLDDEDQPLPGVRVEVELPDGRTRSGTTSQFGLVRIESISTPGTCKVRFLGIDGEMIEVV